MAFPRTAVITVQLLLYVPCVSQASGSPRSTEGLQAHRVSLVGWAVFGALWMFRSRGPRA
jgi:hypothetical protein